MKTEFNHAANDSPRSGSTKKVAPVVGVAIVIAIIVFVIGPKMLAERWCATARTVPLRGRFFFWRSLNNAAVVRWPDPAGCFQPPAIALSDRPPAV